MNQKSGFRSLLSLVLAILLTMAMVLPAGASAAVGMGNFVKTREYSGFSDVPAGQWYSNDVKQAYELGLMDGKDGGRFDPDGNLTLAEAVTMAARVCAIYYGEKFVPGGSPWYQNAVDYAIENGIIYDGEYTDFRAKATRADFANLLYWAIPSDEFPRINRIAWISDIDPNNAYFHDIYLLYGAGVLTGSETGAFQPNEPVRRSEAAAIITRVAWPENRVSLSVTTNAPGKVIDGANRNFKISLPMDQGWELTSNEILEFEGADGGTVRSCTTVCAHTTDGGDMDILVEVMAYPKKDLSDWTLSWMSEEYMTALIEEAGGQIDEDGVEGCTFRGLLGYCCGYAIVSEGIDYHCEAICVENSTYLYLLNYMIVEDFSDELDKQLDDVLFSLDIAL